MITVTRALDLSEVGEVAELAWLAHLEQSQHQSAIDRPSSVDPRTAVVARTAAYIADGRNQVLVARVDGEAAGLIIIAPSTYLGAGGNTVSVPTFFIKECYRGNRVARHLWREFHSRIKDLYVQAQVLVGNEVSSKLFEHYGFRQVAVVMEREPDYGGQQPTGESGGQREGSHREGGNRGQVPAKPDLPEPDLQCAGGHR